VPAVLTVTLCVEAVNPPGPDQEYDDIPAVAAKVVDEPEQTVLVPVMLHEGLALTVIVPVAIGFTHGEPVVVTV